MKTEIKKIDLEILPWEKVPSVLCDVLNHKNRGKLDSLEIIRMIETFYFYCDIMTRCAEELRDEFCTKKQSQVDAELEYDMNYILFTTKYFGQIKHRFFIKSQGESTLDPSDWERLKENIKKLPRKYRIKKRESKLWSLNYRKIREDLFNNCCSKKVLKYIKKEIDACTCRNWREARGNYE